MRVLSKGRLLPRMYFIVDCLSVLLFFDDETKEVVGKALVQVVFG